MKNCDEALWSLLFTNCLRNQNAMICFTLMFCAQYPSLSVFCLWGAKLTKVKSHFSMQDQSLVRGLVSLPDAWDVPHEEKNTKQMIRFGFWSNMRPHLKLGFLPHTIRAGVWIHIITSQLFWFWFEKLTNDESQVARLLGRYLSFSSVFSWRLGRPYEMERPEGAIFSVPGPMYAWYSNFKLGLLPNSIQVFVEI